MATTLQNLIKTSIRHQSPIFELIPFDEFVAIIHFPARCRTDFFRERALGEIFGPNTCASRMAPTSH